MSYKYGTNGNDLNWDMVTGNPLGDDAEIIKFKNID